MQIQSQNKMIEVMNEKFPTIKNWYIYMPNLIGSFIPYSERHLLNQQDLQIKCSFFTNICQTSEDSCNRTADIGIITGIVNLEDSTLIQLKIRYYCAICLYITLSKALNYGNCAERATKIHESKTPELESTYANIHIGMLEDMMGVVSDMVTDNYEDGIEIIRAHEAHNNKK